MGVFQTSGLIGSDMADLKAWSKQSAKPEHFLVQELFTFHG